MSDELPAALVGSAAARDAQTAVIEATASAVAISNLTVVLPFQVTAPAKSDTAHGDAPFALGLHC
jgi:hypothetical protein